MTNEVRKRFFAKRIKIIMSDYKLYTDGGARGNPGPAGIGFVLYENDQNIYEFNKYIGNCTNNVAEYMALITGLMYASQKEIKNVNCFLDSELVVKQLNGLYKVKHKDMIPLYNKVKELQKLFDNITFANIPREQNKLADSLVNKALDEQANNSK